jgi:NAD(P)-dependent dehydrogenase (short-subunit alcohol dehydrogenase family)
MGESLKGKCAIVTGAGRGIGAAIALAFAREGANVALAARTIEQLHAVRDQIVALGRRALVIPTDMGVPAQVEALVQQSIAGLGAVDIVVSNAASPGPMAPLTAVSADTWREIQSVNLDGPLTLLRAIAPHMLQRGSGSVIVISSIRGTNGVPYGGAYAASKAALNSITRTLACEWGPHGVRVNAICPGPVETYMVTSVLGDNKALHDYYGQLAPLKGWTQPEDCAGPAVFLASDAARAITGHLLVVDGGLSATLQDAFAPPAHLLGERP